LIVAKLKLANREKESPEDKGTCVLLASVAQMTRLEIGRLGTFCGRGAHGVSRLTGATVSSAR
jgi:hypothetical protein